MLDLTGIYRLIDKRVDRESLGDLSWTGSIGQYLSLILENREVCRTVPQRLRDMIVSPCTEEPRPGESAPGNVGGSGASSGCLQELAERLRALSFQSGVVARTVLLCGSPEGKGPALVRGLMEGYESYSRTPEGALFSFRWKLAGGDAGGALEGGEAVPCPYHEEVLRLVPETERQKFLSDLKENAPDAPGPSLEGPLCPSCRSICERLLKKYHGDWARAMEHVEVYRLVPSAERRTALARVEGTSAGASGGEGAGLDLGVELRAGNRGILDCGDFGFLDGRSLATLAGLAETDASGSGPFLSKGLDFLAFGQVKDWESLKLSKDGLDDAFRAHVVEIQLGPGA